MFCRHSDIIVGGTVQTGTMLKVSSRLIAAGSIAFSRTRRRCSTVVLRTVSARNTAEQQAKLFEEFTQADAGRGPGSLLPASSRA